MQNIYQSLSLTQQVVANIQIAMRNYRDPETGRKIMSKPRLAELSGVTKYRLEAFFNRKTEPTIVDILCIANALGVPFWKLVPLECLTPRHAPQLESATV